MHSRLNGNSIQKNGFLRKQTSEFGEFRSVEGSIYGAIKVIIIYGHLGQRRASEPLRRTACLSHLKHREPRSRPRESTLPRQPRQQDPLVQVLGVGGLPIVEGVEKRLRAEGGLALNNLAGMGARRHAVSDLR
jgi:hypothetical protein